MTLVDDAAIVGNGEGDWVGGMHGCTRGTFDGEASVTGGELQHLHHVAIGGAAGDAGCGKCCYFLVLWACSCPISHVPTRMTRSNRESITL